MRDRVQTLIRRSIPSGSVVQRTAKSGIWRFATKVSGRGLQLLMLIVLARLLTPRDFGILGIALLTLSATKRFTDIGLNAALIQQAADNVDDYLDTTWVLEIARGVLIGAALFAAAPLIAGFFGEPDATLPIQVIALAPLLYGLRNPGVVYFHKDLAFHRDFLYRSGGSTAQFVVGVGYALVSPTVWALVFAFLARDAVQCLLSFFLHPYRPWPAFDLGQAIELIHYGKWITGSSIVAFLYSEGDDAFVGWYLSATALGFYQYAYRIADAPSTEVSEVIAQVMFPAFSKLQDDATALTAAFLQTTRFISFAVFPLSFGLVAIAPTFVPVILGPDWNPMIPVLQLLAIYGLLHAATRTYGSLWKAINRPDLMVKLPVIGVCCIALTIWPATARWGIVGTGLSVVGVSLLIVFPINVYVTARLLGISPLLIFKEYIYPLIASIVMLIVLLTGAHLVAIPPVVEWVVMIPVGAVVYFGTAYLLERQFDWGIEENIRTVVKGVAG